MPWKFALLTLLACCYATPPGRNKPPELFDEYPPKYEYGYTIQDNKGSGYGKLESREGVFSLGRYFVQLGGPKGASQNVEYITDEWGYHPLVEYSSIGDHSTTSTQFALGEKAVEALRKNSKTQNPVRDYQKKISQPQPTIQSPSPTQSTALPTRPVTPIPSPTPVTILKTPASTPQPKLPKIHNPIQENPPNLQNTIPLQYFLPFNFQQAQYLYQPQNEQLPQPQFLIQDHNISPTQFIFPLYDNNFQHNFNPPPTQQTVSNHEQNVEHYSGQKNILKLQNIDLRSQNNSPNQFDNKRNNIVSHDNHQQTQEVNNGIQQSDNNQGQYLIELKPQQNVFIPPQNNNIVIPNSGQNVETSTAKYNENLKQNQKDIQYLTQAIQNDLNLQNTEPLFGNTASEVKYSNRNKHREQNSYDESVLELENPGGYGSKIRVKKPSEVKSNQDFNTRLIDRTRNLVTGVDVLNINDAISNFVAAQAESDQHNKNMIAEYTSRNVQYGYNENIPNTILETVSNLNNNREQRVVDYDNEKAQQSNNENDNSDGSNQQNLITSSSTYTSKTNAIQNTRTKLLEILNSEKIQSKEQKPVSLAEQPIIVADYDSYQDNFVQSTTGSYKEEKNIAETIFSTTQNTIETKITENDVVSTASPVLITPRPISNAFLAPITAAVSLQNGATDLQDLKQDNYSPESSVEVQKSIPYYLGKVEFIENQENYSSQKSSEEEALSTKLVVQKQNSEQESSEEQVISEESSNSYPRAEALISNNRQNNLNTGEVYIEDQIKKENNSALEFKQTLDEPTAEAQESKIVNKPAELTKLIDHPYPIEVPIGIPYPVEKPIPIEVEKIVEKPVQVTQVVEKRVPIHIPQPYPVEVEKVVEKQVQVPVQVTKYVNRPYPVHIPYPEPIAVPVEVEKLVRTIVKEPYPVEVPIPVEIPVKVPVHVTKYIDKPYPVEKFVEKPVPVEKIIEKPVTKYIEKPYPVTVHVPVPHPVAIPVEIKIPQPYPVEITKYIEKPYGLAQAYSAPVPKTVKPSNHPQVKHPITKLVQIPVEIPKHYERPVYVNYYQHHKQSPYLYAPKYQIDWKNLNCEPHKHKVNQGQHRFKIQDYIGLVPPLAPQNSGKINPNYKRKARNSFEQNLRIEYGFKPPIVPSIQTDEYGMPLEKEE